MVTSGRLAVYDAPNKPFEIRSLPMSAATRCKR